MRSIQTEKVFLVSFISDALQILPHIVTLPQIDSIFVFNWESINYESLIFEHSKLTGIYNDLDLLCLSIKEQIDFLDRHLKIFSFFDQNEHLTKDLSKHTADLLWFQLYHDVLFQLPYDEEAKQEMIDVCRSYYRDNIKELEMINKFESEYQSEEALQCFYMNNIGTILCKQEKYDEALDYHQQALELQEKYASCHSDITKRLNYIGNILFEKEKYDEALKFYQRVLENQENYYPHDHVDIVTTLNNIGITLRKQQQFDEAIKYYQKALEIQEKYYPSGSTIIANTVNRIGHALYDERKYDAAIDFPGQSRPAVNGRIPMINGEKRQVLTAPVYGSRIRCFTVSYAHREQ
ncbi:unnamed protein product [Rotaria sordida]|uniref:Uncharacterized protein n=1 Tax=Rotaria sordida TaxID=392033 RepID=A0A819RHR2_9BILA|nr:unnamed protein product [Rotaria sordida]